MTATMDFNTELITIQNNLKKYIFHHQMLLVNNKAHDQNAKSKLALYEKKIIQLCERQNLVTNNLRKERINASNLDHHQLVSKSFLVHNQTIQNLPKSKAAQFLAQTQEKSNALRPSFSGKKLLIPVSAAAATSKKPNQQILVIPMPDGGARLAATSNASRSTLNKSSSFNKTSNGYTSNSSMGNSLLNPSSKTTQYNNFTITNTTKMITLSSNLNIQNSRIINDRATITTNSLPSELMTTTSLVKRKQLTQSLHNDPPIIYEKPVPKVDETKLKEEFFAKLGLVTKQALSEIQNKKSERKRRTTANPQFSNAAIEAKRITAQELAAKKANRKRELAASNQDNLINAGNKRSFLNSNRGGKQDAKRNVPKVNQKQFSSQNNEIKVSSNFARCFVCNEVCDSDLDEIMFCSDCHCLFHSRHFTLADDSGRACSSAIARTKKTVGVPCPKCERKRSLADDDDSNESSNVLKQKALDSSNSNSSSVTGKVNYRRKLENSRSAKNKGKLTDKDAKQSKKSQDVEPKLAEEQYESFARYKLLDRQVRDFRVKLALLKDKVYISKENRREMLIKKENSKRAIDSIINLVKMIQDIEKYEQKENRQQNELVEQVSEIVNTQPTEQVISNEEEKIAESNKLIQEIALIQENDQVNETDDRVLINEADEAVNNLSALAGLAVAELEEINSLKNSALNQQEPLVAINLEVEVKDEQETVENDTEVLETNIITESTIEESNIEELNVIELKALDQSQVSSDPLQDNTNEPLNDEPPTKKLRLSPVPEQQMEIEVQESIQDVQVCISQEDLDDEVSAAIASIPT